MMHRKRPKQIGPALAVTAALLAIGAGSAVNPTVRREERGTGGGPMVVAEGVQMAARAGRAPAAGGAGARSSGHYGTLPSAGYGTIRPGPPARAGNPPVGSLQNLPGQARQVMHQNRPYYFNSGYWYAPAYYGYDLYYYPVIAPVGAVVGSVPPPAQWVVRGNARFVYSQGVYYQPFTYGGLVYYRVVGTD